jgi:hypothetical protein
VVATSPAPEYQDRLADLLIACPIDSLRNPTRALELATQTTAAAPANLSFATTLAAAHCALEQWDEAVAAIAKVESSGDDADAKTHYVLSIAQWSLNQPEESHHSFEQGSAWQARHQPGNMRLTWLKQHVAAQIGANLSPDSMKTNAVSETIAP